VKASRKATLGRQLVQISILCLLFLFAEPIESCTFARGYFFQVTHLNGRVVGRSLGLVQFRWLRRMFPLSGAQLTLYDYSQPIFWDNRPPAVARVKANSQGAFDFGDVHVGHYTLEISSGELDEFFDVEITAVVPMTKSVLIDVSPVGSDCSGGHEFEVEKLRK
jgi:hypothetical protein